MRCIRCNEEMDSTTGGSYICHKCGLEFNDLVYRSQDYEVPPHQSFVKRGWVCPLCGRGVSPWIDFCPCKSDLKITYGAGTEYENLKKINWR